MKRGRLTAITAAAALILPVSALAGPPKLAPPRYATQNYQITFATPPGSTYCPLPKDWVGSDHGTTLFLTPPRDCGGAGYPSSDRGFSPATTPRIEVYYGFAPDPDDMLSPCRTVGRARLLGRQQNLCEAKRNGMTTIDLRGHYEADEHALFGLTLVTAPSRLAADLRTLRALAASVRSCAGVWDEARGRSVCPAGVTWF